MTLDELIASFREDASDTVEPFLWETEHVTRWLNEAQDEAAIRGRLLLDDSTPAVTTIEVLEGKASYQLHPKVFEIAHLHWQQGAGSSRGRTVKLVSREWLDDMRPGWRGNARSNDAFAIQNERALRLVPTPQEAGTLTLEAYRLPIKLLANDNDKPEIHEAHHAYLVHWALHRAFSKPDSDGFDSQRAATSERAFTDYFGPRPDSDLRRSTRHDEPQVNVAYIF